MIYEVKNFFNPTKEQINKILQEITELLKINVGVDINEIKKIEEGQNLNFALSGFDLRNNMGVKFLLKIISKKGYPNIEELVKCYELLNSRFHTIIYHDSSSLIAPYGFVVQKWIDGEIQLSNKDIGHKYDENEDIRWLKDFVKPLKKVHSVKFDYFGSINGSLNFSSIHEYYNNIDEVVRWSFGKIKDEGIILNELVRHKVLDDNFLKYVLSNVKRLAENIGVKESVLIYGDMFPSNLIYQDNEPIIIDWDECRANWWVYEIARTTFYVDSNHIARKFIEYYNPTDPLEEIDIGIRIEHVKQHLRKICILCMNREKDLELMKQVTTIKNKIINRIKAPFLF